MIKNIVFDIGNVLAKYFPSSEITKFNTSLEKIKSANEVIVKEKMWRMYLNGLVELNTLLEFLNRKNPEFNKEFNILLLPDNQKYIIKEIHENVKILESLSKKYDTYILSNITKETFEYMDSNYQFTKVAKGKILSYEEHLSKPDKRIYIRLLEKFNLNPVETIFIDDKIKNIEEAEKQGIRGLLYDKNANLYNLLKKEGIEIEYTDDNC